jgi:hypothetical protein
MFLLAGVKINGLIELIHIEAVKAVFRLLDLSGKYSGLDMRLPHRTLKRTLITWFGLVLVSRIKK